MSVTDVLKKVQRIQIVASRTVDDLFAGQYKSVFRGRGMEFDEVRPYQPGDDIRTIDWNVTARTGDCFIKRFSEERELTVLFVVDISASGVFGSIRRSKLEVAVEIAALLMFSALRNNDKVGLVTFGEDVVDFMPPRKGKSHVLNMIRHLVDMRPIARPTNLHRPLEFVNRVQKRRAVVFVISDFLGEFPRKTLGITHGRHDVTAITVSDARERELPDVGFIQFKDAETGEVLEIDTSHAKVRRAFAESARQRELALKEQLRRVGVDQLAIETDSDYAASLRRFFVMRERRFR